MKKDWQSKLSEELNRRFAPHRNKIRWKDYEVQLIRDNYLRLSDKEIHEQLLPHRPHKAITYKRCAIGCHKRMQKHQVWTPEEISLLREHWKNYNQRQLKEKFFPNKTVEQVRSRKMHDGLKGRRIWTEEERELLFNHGEHYDMHEMHEKFLPNKTPLQISNMRKYFGIKRGGKKSRCNI